MKTQSKKPKLMVENISCVIPESSQLGGLFVGNIYGAQNAAVLKEYGIRAVLTTSIQTDINYKLQDIPFHLRIQAHDKQDYLLIEHLQKCIAFINQSRKFTNVFVHCYAGVSRSVAVVCSYIMSAFMWDYQTTYAFVQSKRVVAKPNEGFKKQLLQFQGLLFRNQFSIQTPLKNNVNNESLKNISNQSQYSQRFSLPIINGIQKLVVEHKPVKQKCVQVSNIPQPVSYNFGSSSMSMNFKSPQKNHINTNGSVPNSLRNDRSSFDVSQNYSSNYSTNMANYAKNQDLSKTFHPGDSFNTRNSININANNVTSSGNSLNNLNKMHKPNPHSISLKVTSSSSTSGNSFQQDNFKHQDKVLGGKKQIYNHNSIPIPKLQMNNQPSKQNVSKLYSTKGSFFNKNMVEQLKSPRKISMKTQESGLKSPRYQSSNIYTQNMNKTDSGMNKMFSKRQSSDLSKQKLKVTSRCLIKPKDLPGYKHYV